MKVSIIVPVYNDSKRIIPLLKALVNQKYKDEYEILIVDNN